MKHKFKFFLGVSILGLAILGYLLPKETRTESEIRDTISSINQISDDIANVPFSFKEIGLLRQRLNERKEDLKSLVNKLKNLGDFKVNPILAKDLTICFSQNPQKVELKFKQVLKENRASIEKLTNLKLKFNADESPQTFKEIESQSKVLEENINVITEFESLVNDYNEIFEDTK